MFDIILFIFFILFSLLTVWGTFRIPSPDITESQGAVLLGFMIVIILITILATRIAMGVIQ